MKTFTQVDGRTVVIGEGRNPELSFERDTDGLSHEWRDSILTPVREHVRHAVAFGLALGRIYGLDTSVDVDLAVRRCPCGTRPHFAHCPGES